MIESWNLDEFDAVIFGNESVHEVKFEAASEEHIPHASIDVPTIIEIRSAAK